MISKSKKFKYKEKDICIPSLFYKEALKVVKGYSHLEAPRRDPKFDH